MANTVVEVNGVDIIGDDDELSSWEIINPSDDEDTYSFDASTEGDNDDDDDDDDDDVVDDQIVDLESKDLDSFGSLSSVPDPGDPVLVPELPPVLAVVVVESPSVRHRDDYYEEDYEDEEEEEDEEDLDDELVPKWVNDRFGRQRMRKFGKKAYPKINKSKRSAYYYHRPGCVHGKHGLGLKHSLM